jgi:hypothetical protein
MITDFSRPTAPSIDKRWRLVVDATMRRLGNQSRGLIETLHTVQETFGYPDKIHEEGLIRWANLIIATGHNNLAMNRGVLQVAKHFVRGDRLTPGMLNRVEALIRAYDPCLSCSTHAAGSMPLVVQLLDCCGASLDEVRRPS